MNRLLIECVIVFLAIFGYTYTVFDFGESHQRGKDAIAAEKLKQEYDEKVKQVQGVADQASLEHATTINKLSRQLGDARAQIASLTTGRACLSADAVGVLNAIGAGAGMQTTASRPAGAASAVATDRDVGDALAVCRSEYAKVSDQLNKILDVEDKRSGPVPAAK
jgi:hypothetical protein